MSEANNTGMEILDLDTLLGASMEDLDDLPPVGVPPSGHYNLTMTFSIKEIGDDKRKVPACEYVIDAINELKNEDERSEVVVGQTFTEFFHLVKKDGSKNVFGIGTLKQRLAPFAERFGTGQIGALINEVKQMAVTASISRRQNRKNEEQYNMSVKDLVIL